MNIALATSFATWDDSYSICHVVELQANAFAALGHDVEIWTEEGLSNAPRFHEKVSVRPCFSKHKYRVDNADPAAVEEKFQEFTAALADFRPDIVLDHDLLFQSPLIAYAEAIHRLPLVNECVWFHIVHSACSRNQAIVPGSKCRRELPFGHYLLALGNTHRRAVKRHYQQPLANVFTCPNPCDILDRAEPVSRQIADDLRLMDRDLFQVYPISGTRFEGKGLNYLIDIFDAAKGRGHDVCLFIANGHSNGEAVKKQIAAFEPKNLGPDDLIFTSVRWPEWELAVPHRVILDLFRLSNVFIFPSRAEACSLALIEAQNAGCLCVLNEKCEAQMDYESPRAMRFEFDGLHVNTHHHCTQRQVTRLPGGKEQVRIKHLSEEDSRAFELHRLVDEVVAAIEQDPSLMARRHAMRTYAPHVIGRRITDLAAIARERTCPSSP